MAELRTHRELIDHGETALVSTLMSLPAAYTVLPHLSLPGRQWQQDPDDIDAVVLGPNGIFLLDYKHWHGRIQVAADAPWRHVFVAGGGEERRNPLPLLVEKHRSLGEFLESRHLGNLPVYEVIAFPDRSPIDGAEVHHGMDVLGDVPLLNLGQVTSWITRAGTPGALSPATQAAIAEQLRPASPKRLVNQYELTSRLSRTEDKTTYLAFDTVLERPVLLQELAYDPYQQPAQLERVRNELLREAKLTMQLKHAHIVNVEHVIPRDDCYYVVTEWIDNCQTLAQVLARRNHAAFGVDEAVAAAIAIADALAYAHAQGIVHRDVRPENVLVAPQGIVKVANFAHAKKADLGTRSTFDLRQMAQENPYVAPEFRLGQGGHHQVDQRADIFSLGALLYQLLTGKLPHHLDEKYFELPSAINPQVPPALDEAIEKALRFDPAQRYSTMAAFRERLEQYRTPAASESARYTQRKLVKRTRSSLVFQALDTKLARQVGLKKLLLDPRLSEAERAPQLHQLLREAQLASSLVHPHIISVFDHFIEDGDGYIVMEWLEGQNLRELMDAKSRLGVPAIKGLAEQVGKALQYAHSQGVVHRDIKPENIIYHQGQATVLDFGIAHTLDRAQSADIQKTAGTARYMAPEVLSGGEVDVRADIFSLGVVLYELITGQYPYEASTIMARYTAQLVQPPQPASALNIDCPPELDCVLQKALEVDPDQRYATVADFLQDFLATGDRRPGRRERVERESGGWGPLVALSLSVFLVCLGGGWYATQSLRKLIVVVPSPTPLAVQTTAVASSAVNVVETPSPSPSPSPSPAPLGMTWESAPITIDGVTVQVTQVAAAAGKTTVTLHVSNKSQDAVAFLNRNDRPDLFQLTDDHGTDYTQSLDLISVDPQLLRIEPGSEVTGGFNLSRAIDPTASALSISLKEYGGRGRLFPLRSMRLVEERR